MAALYAPDAVMLPPDNSVVSGPAIGPYLACLEKGAANLNLTTTDVVRLSPDFIREVGIASFDTLGDKPVNVKGTYVVVVVWTRVGGTWKLWTD
ncbi:MAG TPA: nuclear transport factor 2 family protein, partial [Phenylobacterium sp.]